MKKRLIRTSNEHTTAIMTDTMAVLCSDIYCWTKGKNSWLKEAEKKQVK